MLGGVWLTIRNIWRYDGLEQQVNSLNAKIDEQYRVLHMRITKEQDTRTDEFESLIAKQLEIIKEQNRILYDLHKGK